MTRNFSAFRKAPQFINVFTKAQTMPNISYMYKCSYIQNYNFASCLQECETWLLTLREERRLRMFENRVLKRIFRLKRDEVTREWIKTHNEKLNDLYRSPSIVRAIKSRRIRWAGHVARLGKRRSVYRVLVGKPEGNRPLGRPRRRWEDNIKMDLQEVGCRGMDWIELTVSIGTGGGHL